MQSQLNKLDAMIDQAGITADDHVLELGCGWGSMAIRAVQRTGCKVTGITVRCAWKGSNQWFQGGVATGNRACIALRPCS